MKVKVTTLVFFVLLAGCASKVFQHPLLMANSSEPSAAIYFFREDVFWNSGVAQPVHVNGEALLQLRRATYAKVSLRPGTYQVEARPIGATQPVNPWITCGGPMGFELGKTYFVLLRFQGGDGVMCFSPMFITEEGARSLMATYSAIHQ